MKQSRNYTVYFYLIVPVILMITFAIYFNRFQAEERAKAAEQAIILQEKEAKAKLEQAEMEKKLDAEAKMIADAKAKLAADKEAKEKAERRSKIDELSRRIESAKKDLKATQTRNDEQTQKVKAMRALRVQAEAEWLEKSKELERERAEKSSTDLEAQRLIGMIQDRFDGEWAKILTAPPPPAK